MSKSATSLRIGLLRGLLLSVCVLSPLHADDTEIFFGQSDDAFNNNPNILFVLDSSGSMSTQDPGFDGVSRMDRLKTAMGLLLDQSSSYNVGLMAFQGYGQGGAIRYPVGYLESESTELCDGACPDEKVVVRPDGGNNDGTQHDTSKLVNLAEDSLVMAEIVAANTSEETSTDTVITNSAVAVADVSEFTEDDGSTLIHSNNQAINRWFHDGTDSHGAGYFAYRFDNIEIPRGATITHASITFVKTDAANQHGEVSAYISAEATPDPQEYPNGSNATLSLAERSDPSRRTSALVPWDPVPPDNSASAEAESASPETDVETPDLSSIVSELVSQPGWTQGNRMSFLLAPFDSYIATASDTREFHGSAAVASKLPVLNYTYTEADDPDLTTTEAEASAHVDEFSDQNTEVVYRHTANPVSQLFHAGVQNNARELALRFDNLDIPAGATIKNAYLTLMTAEAAASASPDNEWQAVEGTGNGLESETDETTDSGDDSASPVPDDIGFSINISAELENTPEDYSNSTLGERTYSSTFVNWADVASDPDTELVSPNLTALISEVTSLDDWTSGNAISLRLTAPEDHYNSSSNLRDILTSSASHKPGLLITWEPAAEDDADTQTTQTTAIRFSHVHIPPGAQIKSARIVFHSAEATDEETSLDIAGEKSANSAPLTTALNDLGDRDRTTAQETWIADPWLTVGTTYDTPDLSRIVQEITDQPDWCGGNNMSFFIAGTGKRVAVSADANPIKAPTLEISYAPDSVPTGSYCSNSSISAQTGDSRNDAVQNISSGMVVLDGQSLDTDSSADGTGQGQLIGLRFKDVNVPSNARIVSATLKLTSNEETLSNSEIGISVEQADSARDFSPLDNDVSGRNWSSEISWTSPAHIGAGEATYSADLKTLIEQTVSRSGWARGNAMAFRLTPREFNQHRSFASFDANEAQAAQLIIYFESERESPGTRFRDNLKRHVDELVAMGGTPITSSLYEAALYFRSEAVDYGTHRGAQAWQDRYHRVSHPFSYEGGELSRPAGCSDAYLDSENCIMETINNHSSTPTYISPMESQCQTNHIVLLSDGVATSNTAAERIRNLTGLDCDASTDQTEECGRELVQWLHDSDLSDSLSGMQNVTTHTIAFNLAEQDRGYLADLAAAGGGGAYSADSASSLLTAFQSIFLNVSKTDTSFVAPSVTLAQQNRLKNREDLYFAMFKPESTARWDGNIKKFLLQGNEDNEATIVDQDLLPAVDEISGNFKAGARSFWSNATDGGSVLLGGATSRMKVSEESHLSRRVFTYTGTTSDLTHADNAVLPTNSKLDPEWFALPPNLASDADFHQDLVNWTHGKDIRDIDGDGNTDEARGQMGDPLHSQPILLNYASGSDVDSVVFVATNEGFLHALDTDTGDERYAFIPRELLKNMYKLLANEPTLRRPYGLDGGMTSWIDDSNDNGIIDSGEKAYLYIAMRRGGSQYYALDVSDINNPKFLWSIQGRTNTLDTDLTTADGDFVELGDTWSRPVRTRVRDGSSVVDVLVFGGGYDPNQDPTASSGDEDFTEKRTTDGVGRAVFIVDAKTGTKLWQTNRAGTFSGMDYSIPSDIRVIDIDFDGLADQLYAGDMGGQIWRIDINNDVSLTDSLEQRIDGGRIAELAGDDPEDARRFYYPPDVSIMSIDGQQQLAISIGSGWRAHPLDDVVQDRFYSLRLPHVYGKPIDSFGLTVYPSVSHTSSGLVDVTDKIDASLPLDAKGWFMDLEEDGEKTLSSSVTADHKVLFTTYLPEAQSSTCSAAEGSGKVYAVSVFNGAPVLDLDKENNKNDLTKEDRARTLDHAGIPPPTSLLFPEVGNATVVVGTETLQELDLNDLRRRTFWQEKIEEDS
ncbi:PilC/PilY family type IV pilus protein [Granulosicoccus sp. 3-233]|uniref:pilus assembly protein n=1 Tax=Granulosicoccus sp. 3-233 TaxID=3417969 RepID=UPI003D3366BE